MGTDSGIPYVHHTWGPWRGCTKVSAGCNNCYMFREQRRWDNDPTKVVRCSKGNWRQPFKKVTAGQVADGLYPLAQMFKEVWQPGDRVMVCPWSDFFHPAADEWREEAWGVMGARPDIHWIVPTKRTERIPECFKGLAGFHVESLTILASVENQAMADKRIPELLEAKAEWPCFHAGVSLEPMLEYVDLRSVGWAIEDADWVCNALTGEAWCQNSDSPSGYVDDCPKLEWVIIGAENAPKDKVRHCPSVNIHSAKCDCQSAGVPVYVKQIHYDDKDCSGRLNKMPKGWTRQYPDYMESE